MFIIQMLSQSEDEEAYNQVQLSDSQFNDYIRKIDEQQLRDEKQPFFQSQNQLQPLIYSTLQLQYNIALNEEEFKFYKSLLAQKEAKIKQLKQKITKKNSKVAALVEGVTKTQKKIKEVTEGYKHLSQKHQQSVKNENGYRNKRLDWQQRKNHLYKKLCELQAVQQNYINDIYSYQQLDQEYNEICSENERMQQEIDKLQTYIKDVNEGSVVSSRKDELKASIKKLYEKIKLAEKEQNQISQEYQNKKKKLKMLQKQQLSINNKNVEISGLLTRISKVKEECRQAAFSKTELENQYRGLLTEESVLKKNMVVQNQPNSAVKKRLPEEKAKIVHNFKIIDSEADEELKFNSKNRSSSMNQNNSTESQGQLDDLITRFQKIKSKSKTKI